MITKREAQRFEEAIVLTSKEGGRQGIVQLPGVADALAVIAAERHLPNPAWAICTSATRTYASSALRIAGIPVPDVFVAAEDVKKGKPFRTQLEEAKPDFIVKDLSKYAFSE
ncbi:hypothetical protein C0992_004442 [Termitomyces sp. T32_za158]|nr:hypothetical protein C0992_004442 [Termitomyces sp. T32_za158]